MHTKRDNAILTPKRNSVVNAFLLFKYKHASTQLKEQYEKETRIDRIARTMRLEGDWVSNDDVRKFLKQ